MTRVFARASPRTTREVRGKEAAAGVKHQAMSKVVDRPYLGWRFELVVTPGERRKYEDRDGNRQKEILSAPHDPSETATEPWERVSKKELNYERRDTA